MDEEKERSRSFDELNQVEKIGAVMAVNQDSYSKELLIELAGLDTNSSDFETEEIDEFFQSEDILIEPGKVYGKIRGGEEDSDVQAFKIKEEKKEKYLQGIDRTSVLIQIVKVLDDSN